MTTDKQREAFEIHPIQHGAYQYGFVQGYQAALASPEVQKLVGALLHLMQQEHEYGGALGNDGQFYYKVPERTFELAIEALTPFTQKKEV